MSPRWGSTPRLTDRLTVSRNVTLTLTLTLIWWCCMLLSSAREAEKGWRSSTVEGATGRQF
jgi:hypothetical protein